MNVHRLQKGFGAVELLLVLGVIGFISGATLYILNRNREPANTVPSGSHWKVYTNPRYKLSFEYQSGKHLSSYDEVEVEGGGSVSVDSPSAGLKTSFLMHKIVITGEPDSVEGYAAPLYEVDVIKGSLDEVVDKIKQHDYSQYKDYGINIIVTQISKDGYTGRRISITTNPEDPFTSDLIEAHGQVYRTYPYTDRHFYKSFRIL